MTAARACQKCITNTPEIEIRTMNSLQMLLNEIETQKRGPSSLSVTAQISSSSEEESDSIAW